MSMTADAGLSASMSNGSGWGSTAPAGSAAPGATGPLAQIGVDKAVITTIVVSAAALVALRMTFGRGKLPPLRVDATNALNIYFSWLLVNGTVKVIAYKYHGHKVAQAYLLVA